MFLLCNQWIVLFWIIFSTLIKNSHQLNRVCYLRPNSSFPVREAIQLDLCTHILVGFSSIDGDANVAHGQSTNDFLFECKQNILHYKPNTKLMVSIGGGGAGGFELATNHQENRQRFIHSILRLIQRFQLDGIDIDWEFPSWPVKSQKQHEKDNLVHLLKETRQSFNQYQLDTGKSLVLSLAVAAQVVLIDASYKPLEIEKYVDFINLMTYDFHMFQWYWPFTGHNSALYPRSLDFGIFSTMNVNWSAHHWNKIGLSKEKIMIGIPAYGKRFTLLSTYMNFPGSIAVSGKEDCSYSFVCDFVRLNEASVEKFDEEAKVPYASNNYDWISFENVISARFKADWIVQNGFGGAMTFSLNTDDYTSRCNQGLFPIHSAVRDVFAKIPAKESIQPFRQINTFEFK